MELLQTDNKAGYISYNGVNVISDIGETLNDGLLIKEVDTDTGEVQNTDYLPLQLNISAYGEVRIIANEYFYAYDTNSGRHLRTFDGDIHLTFSGYSRILSVDDGTNSITYAVDNDTGNCYFYYNKTNLHSDVNFSSKIDSIQPTVCYFLDDGSFIVSNKGFKQFSSSGVLLLEANYSIDSHPALVNVKDKFYAVYWEYVDATNYDNLWFKELDSQTLQFSGAEKFFENVNFIWGPDETLKIINAWNYQRVSYLAIAGSPGGGGGDVIPS